MNCSKLLLSINVSPSLPPDLCLVTSFLGKIVGGLKVV